MSFVVTDIRDSIGTITLAHAPKRNALSAALIEELIAALTEFRTRKVRVVILRAEKGAKVWSAGHDVAELPQSDGDPLGWDDPLRRLIREANDFPVPIIAMVEGGVWGGACELAMVCDIVVAAEGATFAFTPAKLGVPYNLAGLQTFMQAIPIHVVKEMAFAGEPMGAERAERLGIINHVLPAEELEGFTYTLAEHISQNSPLSIAVMKEGINSLANAHHLTPETFERIQELRARVYCSQDYREGIRAFIEKRKPNFTGE
jgi:methylmalonyl-CoA decarboxylase